MRLNQPPSARCAAFHERAIGSGMPDAPAADSCEGNDQTIVAFDSLAWRYDDLFSHSRIGIQRGAVWDVVADSFRPGDAILLLNCRTREDATFLAMLGVSVVACAADGLIHTGRNQMQPEAPDAPVHLDLPPTEPLTMIRPGALFDGVLLNFSGLNSVADLKRTARDLTSIVTIGAPVIICLSTGFCLSETFWFLLHGKFRKAFRRSFGIATVRVGGCAIKIHYPGLREVRKLFSPSFLMRSCRGIGIAVPPSYLEPIFRKYPRMLGLLRRIDRGISHLPLLRTIGDHMLLYLERVDT
jgi:hypothetical protein